MNNPQEGIGKDLVSASAGGALVEAVTETELVSANDLLSRLLALVEERGREIVLSPEQQQEIIAHADKATDVFAKMGDSVSNALEKVRETLEAVAQEAPKAAAGAANVAISTHLGSIAARHPVTGFVRVPVESFKAAYTF